MQSNVLNDLAKAKRRRTEKTIVARSTFRSKNIQSTRVRTTFWRFRCRFASLHQTTGHYTTLHSSTLHYTAVRSSTLHYTKLHYTTLHYTTLHYTTLHYITLHYTTLHYTALHYTTLHYTTVSFTTLHSITLQLQLHNSRPHGSVGMASLLWR